MHLSMDRKRLCIDLTVLLVMILLYHTNAQNAMFFQKKTKMLLKNSLRRCIIEKKSHKEANYADRSAIIYGEKISR